VSFIRGVWKKAVKCQENDLAGGFRKGDILSSVLSLPKGLSKGCCESYYSATLAKVTNSITSEAILAL